MSLAESLIGITKFDKWSRSKRRRVMAKGAAVRYPYKIDDPGQNLKKADQKLKKGEGLFVLTPHITEGEFVREFAMLGNSLEMARKVPLLVPITSYQLYLHNLMRLTKLADIEAAPIVTADTLREEERYREQGLEIPWETGRNENFGYVEFLMRSFKVLSGNEGGIVIEAPSQRRTPFMEPFPNRPIEAVCRPLESRGHANRIAIMFLGLEIPGVEDYADASIKGTNKGVPYKMTVGPVMELSTFRQWSSDNGRTLDEQARRMLIDLSPHFAPPGYSRFGSVD